MPLTAPKQQTNRVLAPQGTHMARIISLIQIGTISTEYMGEQKWLEKLRLTWELPTELHAFKEGEDKKPLVISQEYTHSMGSKSNLRPIVEGIIGVSLNDDEAYSFDMEYLVGKECLVTIAHKESKTGAKYALVKSTAPVMKGMIVPPAVNPSKILTYENWDQEQFDALPQFIREEMEGSKQYVAKFGPTPTETISPEDIPF